MTDARAVTEVTAHEIDPPVLAFLTAAGLLHPGSEPRFTPLTGGVASDIWKVDAGAGRKPFVVKRALARLRVAQEWKVSTTRNTREVDWIKTVDALVPGAAPAILADDPERGLFAMTFLDPATHPVWKTELAAGRADPAFASRLGRLLAAIHTGTAGREDLDHRLGDNGGFRAIRIAPYLEATALRHPQLSARLRKIGEEVLANHRALVHGDVSPKNILCGPGGPVLLDAECAWYGDPAFDLAFCLNHLLLKGLWIRANASAFLACFDALADSYLSGVSWEDRDDIERRAAALLPALLLARVDGKSPVEYLTEDSDRTLVRAVACPLIAEPPGRLAVIHDIWLGRLHP